MLSHYLQSTHDTVRFDNTSGANEWSLMSFQQQTNPSLTIASVVNEWSLMSFPQQTNPSIVVAHQQRGMWWKVANNNQTH